MADDTNTTMTTNQSTTKQQQQPTVRSKKVTDMDVLLHRTPTQTETTQGVKKLESKAQRERRERRKQEHTASVSDAMKANANDVCTKELTLFTVVVLRKYLPVCGVQPCYELGQESLRCSLANPATKSEACKQEFWEVRV